MIVSINIVARSMSLSCLIMSRRENFIQCCTDFIRYVVGSHPWTKGSKSVRCIMPVIKDYKSGKLKSSAKLI